MTEAKKYSTSIIVLIFFAVIGFVLYAPVLGNTFLSDDYDSLYRIYIQKRILYREFLRPMIDISFYFNYLVSGLDPWSFYVFNVVIHILNAWLLFRLCLGLQMFEKKEQFVCAFLAAFLFIIYPFHNESISWLSGRLSSMAFLFALLSLILARKERSIWLLLMSILCYLVGLLCYESIIIFPLVVFLLTGDRLPSLKTRIVFSLYWVYASVAFLIARVLLANQITGDYGNRITDNNLKDKVLNAAKVMGRLFLPPSENQLVLTISAIILIGSLAAIHVYFFRRRTLKGLRYTQYKSILACLAISLLVPFAFGISTHTSEGDRLLYFPSGFLCILIANWITMLYRKPAAGIVVLIGITFYSVWLLEVNNQHWVRASRSAQDIVDVIRNKGYSHITILNLPDEYEGAFIFRKGLRKLLEINAIDTGSVTVFNHLTWPQYISSGPNLIVPQRNNDSILYIFPHSRVSAGGVSNPVHISNELNNEVLTIEKERNLLYYWNKKSLARLF